MAGKYESRNDQGKHAIAADDPAALKLLKQDHHRFRALFDAANAADGGALVSVAQELSMRLAVHMTIEEELLYPEMKKIVEDEVDEGIVEHDTGKKLLLEIDNLDGTEPLYKSKVHVLGEVTAHHIDEEDEDLFEDAKKAHEAGKIDLDLLGEKMAARQAELYKRIEQTGEMGSTGEADAEEIPTV